MSTMWPFFNSATPNTNIMDILADIEARTQAASAGRAAAMAAANATNALSSSKNPKSPRLKPQPQSILISSQAEPTKLLNTLNSQPDLASTASLSPHIAYSPGTSSQFGVTASELLHSIKQVNEDAITGTSTNSDVISLTSSTTMLHQNDDADSKNLLIDDIIIDNCKDSYLSIFKSFTPIPLEVASHGTTDVPIKFGSHIGHPVKLLNLLLDQQNLLDELNHPKNFNPQKSNTNQKQSKLTTYISSPEVISILIEYILVGFYLSKIIREIKLSNLEGNQSNYDDAVMINGNVSWVNQLELKWMINSDMLDFIWNHDILKEVDDPIDERDNNNNKNSNNTNVEEHRVNDVFDEHPTSGNIGFHDIKSAPSSSSSNTNSTTFNTSSNSFPSLSLLVRALSRSNIASELLVLPSTGIEQSLIQNTSQISRLWRGVLNCKNSWVSGRLDDEHDQYHHKHQKNSSNDDSKDNDEDVYDDNISVSSTDSQKLIEMERENQYDTLRDTIELVLFNNFLKLLDDLTSISAHSMMNFLRFEQTTADEEGELVTKFMTDQLINHLSHSPTMCDLLIRSISLDKPYASTGLIDLLNEQNFIQRVLTCCKEFTNDHLVQDCLCGVLNGIVGISSNVGFWDESNGGNVSNGDEQTNDNPNLNNPNIGPNDLTRNLVSKECIELMIDIIVEGGKYGLVTVVSVVIEVIRKNNSDYDEFEWINSVSFLDSDAADNNTSTTTTTNHHHQDEEDQGENGNDNDNEPLGDDEKRLPSSRDPIYLGTLLKVFSNHLSRIVKRYLSKDYYDHVFTFGSLFKEEEEDDDSSNNYKIPSSIGNPVEALGYERFKIMELLAELLHCSNMMLMNKKIELDFLLWKREKLRHQDVLADLLDDAFGSTIGGEEKIDNLSKSLKNLSTTGGDESSLSIYESYLPTEFNLSIGNYFKYQLMKTNTVPLITLKIFRFPWNNFMHNVVFDLIQQIFNGRLANWDEDRAVNQVETIWDDNLSLNKNLIWSLFGEYDTYENLFETISHNSNQDDYICPNDEFPGFFNLPAFIIFLFNKSNELNEKNNFNYGYMGHLTLIAEEIHKFQNYVENFGLTKSENAFGLKREENDSESAVWWKSSYFVFEELWETIFNGGNEFTIQDLNVIESDAKLKQKYDFQLWLNFVETDLKEISSMYNKVLGNPNELESEQEAISSHNLSDDNSSTKSQNYFDPSDISDGDEEEEGDEDGNETEVNDGHLGLSRNDVLKNMPLEPQPRVEGAIILDNGDDENFRNGVNKDNSDAYYEKEEEEEEDDDDDDNIK